MTTTTKKTKKQATKSRKPATKKERDPEIPSSASVAVIEGKKYVIMPLDDFEEWRDDLLLTAVMQERLESGEPFIPFDDIIADLNNAEKGR